MGGTTYGSSCPPGVGRQVMAITFYTKDDWRETAPLAHICVFDKVIGPDLERVDFALVVGDKQTPHGYITVKEHDGQTAYLQRGGLFEQVRGKGLSEPQFLECLDWFWGRGFTKVFFNVKNDNIPMIKLGLNTGFKISGMRQFKQELLLEMMIERST